MLEESRAASLSASVSLIADVSAVIVEMLPSVLMTFADVDLPEPAETGMADLSSSPAQPALAASGYAVPACPPSAALVSKSAHRTWSL